MPIYEYRCRNCGRVTEILEGVGKDRESPRCCRYCGGNLLTKIISACFLHGGSKKSGGGRYSPSSPEGTEKKEGMPEDCHGNWPANDDYIRLPID